MERNSKAVGALLWVVRGNWYVWLSDFKILTTLQCLSLMFLQGSKGITCRPGTSYETLIEPIMPTP